MTDDLVKRLREDQPVTQDMASTMQSALQDAAADRIEALQAERDALAAELRDVRMSELAALGQAQEAYEQQQALAAEVERIEGERDAALDTLKAWFDRRKLAHEAIDETVLDAVRGYLRTSRSGGMDQKTSDMIENVIADMARLSVFADLFARAALDEGKDG